MAGAEHLKAWAEKHGNMATGSNTKISFPKAVMMHQDFFLSRNLYRYVNPQKHHPQQRYDMMHQQKI